MSDRRLQSESKRLFKLYRIWNTQNNKSYIGITGMKLRKRVYRHFTLLNAGKHHSSDFQADYNQYGRKSFKYEQIDLGGDIYHAGDLERMYIKQYDSFRNGYNMDEGATALPVPCEWNNVKYPSVSEAARANGITYSGMRIRLNKGYTCDADLVGTGSNPTHAVTCVWNDTKYESINAAARDLGITAATMSHRIEQGYTCDEDMTHWNANQVTWNGITYPSQAAAARANGVSSMAMTYRLSQGYACDADLLGHGANAPTVACVWNNIEYPTIKSAAIANGVNPNTMHYRLKKGYTCDADLRTGGNAA